MIGKGMGKKQTTRRAGKGFEERKTTERFEKKVIMLKLFSGEKAFQAAELCLKNTILKSSTAKSG